MLEEFLVKNGGLREEQESALLDGGSCVIRMPVQSDNPAQDHKDARSFIGKEVHCEFCRLPASLRITNVQREAPEVERALGYEADLFFCVQVY